MIGPLRAIARRLAGERCGAAAIEFALVLPLMVLLYLGSVELTQAVSVYRLVDLTAATVTNLVSQYSSISASQTMPDILGASVQVLYPYSQQANPVIVVSLITIDSKGKATVTWSQTLNGAARPVGEVITVPTALDVPSTTLILGEASYSYTPPFDILKAGPFNLTSSIYMVPRAATTINLTS